MRVFYAVHSSGNHHPQNRAWYQNLYLSMIEMGLDVVRFNFDLYGMALHQDESRPGNAEYNAVHRPLLQEALLSQIKAAHARQPIDLFFSYFASSYCSSGTIAEISRMGIVTANWFCNASYQLHLVAEIAPAYDFCLVPEKFRLGDYFALGANPIYCQEAANPSAYSAPFNGTYQQNVTFIGARYADRAAYLLGLHRGGVTPAIFGENWKLKQPAAPERLMRRLLRKPLFPKSALRGYIEDAEVASIYRHSKISLSFSVVGSTHLANQPIRQVRLRDFEIPMSGGFMLAERFEELENFFEPEREMATFAGAEELLEKIKYYLRHDAQREKIRAAGHRRALAQHTWANRLQSAFNHMNLPQIKAAA